MTIGLLTLTLASALIAGVALSRAAALGRRLRAERKYSAGLLCARETDRGFIADRMVRINELVRTVAQKNAEVQDQAGKLAQAMRQWAEERDGWREMETGLRDGLAQQEGMNRQLANQALQLKTQLADAIRGIKTARKERDEATAVLEQQYANLLGERNMLARLAADVRVELQAAQDAYAYLKERLDQIGGEVVSVLAHCHELDQPVRLAVAKEGQCDEPAPILGIVGADED